MPIFFDSPSSRCADLNRRLSMQRGPQRHACHKKTQLNPHACQYFARSRPCQENKPRIDKTLAKTAQPAFSAMTLSIHADLIPYTSARLDFGTSFPRSCNSVAHSVVRDIIPGHIRDCISQVPRVYYASGLHQLGHNRTCRTLQARVLSRCLFYIHSHFFAFTISIGFVFQDHSVEGRTVAPSSNSFHNLPRLSSASAIKYGRCSPRED